MPEATLETIGTGDQVILVSSGKRPEIRKIVKTTHLYLWDDKGERWLRSRGLRSRDGQISFLAPPDRIVPYDPREFERLVEAYEKQRDRARIRELRTRIVEALERSDAYGLEQLQTVARLLGL